MKKGQIILLLAAVVISASCQNTIQYYFDPDDARLTILAQLSTSDEEHSVFLSLSYPDRVDSVPGATVACFVNGERHLASEVPVAMEESIDWETGRISLVRPYQPYTEYRFRAAFNPGDKVRIEAASGNLKAWSELVVPRPATIVSVDTATVVKTLSYQDITGTETYEQEYLEVTMKIRDAGGVDNYFTLGGDMSCTGIVHYPESEEPEHMERFSQGPSRVEYETFHDLVLEDGYASGLGDLFEDFLPVNFMHCFSDKTFRDGEVTVRLYFPSYYLDARDYYWNYPGADHMEADPVLRLHLRTIGRDYYNYLRALNNMQTYGYDVSPIIEPTMLPNNVSEGMGMVSVAADAVFPIDFPHSSFDVDWIIYY